MNNIATGSAVITGNLFQGETLTASIYKLPDVTTSMSNREFVFFVYQQVLASQDQDLLGVSTIDSPIFDYWSDQLLYGKSRQDFIGIIIAASGDQSEPLIYTPLYVSGDLLSVRDFDGIASVNYCNWYADDAWVASGSTYILTDQEISKKISAKVVFTDWAGNIESASGIAEKNVTGIINDTITFDLNYQEIDGGGGLDTVLVDGYLSNYTLIKSSTNYYLNNVPLSDVERIEFSDISVALDISGSTSAGGIYRLYQATFDRTPDTTGLGFWISRADYGQSAIDMAIDFTYSSEFQSLYAVNTLDNYMSGSNLTSLVTKFYQNVLDRLPDSDGLNYYIGVIDSHEKTAGQVLAEISDSSENYLGTVSQIENGIQYIPWII